MKPLRFLHIPKTAGSTLIYILQRQFSGEIEFVFHGDIVSDTEKFDALSENDRGNVMLFTGHAPIRTGIKRADNATTITLLRDPISRVKSFCQHVSEGKSPYISDDFPSGIFCLDDLLESGNEELSNLQTKMLINHGSCASPRLLDTMPPSEAIASATDNLFNSVSHFGLLEYFDESMIIFSSGLKWKMPFYVSQNRKDKCKLVQFEQRHLRRIMELNFIDLEVYGIAKERFISMLETDEFDQKKLLRFQQINKYRSHAINSGRRVIGVVRHWIKPKFPLRRRR
ncbi:MAG: sulfotransferase family protein [Thermoanaerobaculales bacterium]|nr:sulfotransferase family protein [Thermoanaerobaculales bacterium]